MAELQLCLYCDCIVASTTIHVALLECQDAGGVIGALHLSLSVYFSQTIPSFSDFFFFFLVALLSCVFSPSLPSSVLCYHLPAETLVAHWPTSSINLSKNGLDMPLYFSSYHIIFFPLFHSPPSLLWLFTLILSPYLPVPLFNYPSIQHVPSLSIYSQTLKGRKCSHTHVEITLNLLDMWDLFKTLKTTGKKKASAKSQKPQFKVFHTTLINWNDIWILPLMFILSSLKTFLL